MRKQLLSVAACLGAVGILLCVPASLLGVSISSSPLDVDSDGVIDNNDNAIDTFNAFQEDADDDGLGDAADPDSDEQDFDSDGDIDGVDPDPDNSSITGPYTVSLGGPYTINPSETLVTNITFGPISQVVALIFGLGNAGSDGYATIATASTVEIPAE